VAKVADHDGVFREIGGKIRIWQDFVGFIRLTWSSGQRQPALLTFEIVDEFHPRDLDLEKAAVFKVLLHHHRRFRPDRVVVLAIYDQGLELFGGCRR
jgi:hypothetical protein